MGCHSGLLIRAHKFARTLRGSRVRHTDGRSGARSVVACPVEQQALRLRRVRRAGTFSDCRCSAPDERFSSRRRPRQSTLSDWKLPCEAGSQARPIFARRGSPLPGAQSGEQGVTCIKHRRQAELRSVCGKGGRKFVSMRRTFQSFRSKKDRQTDGVPGRESQHHRLGRFW